MKKKSSKKTSLDKKLLGYTATAGAALAAAGTAQGAIIFNGSPGLSATVPLNASGEFEVLDLNIDGAGGNDFQISFSSVDSSLATTASTANVQFAPIAGNEVVISGGYVANLASGVNITNGSTGNRGIITGSDGNSDVTGNFDPASANGTVLGFIGFQFDIGGNRHNGWLELQTIYNNYRPQTITVTRWAYEDTADAAIQAGDTGAIPEPSTVALTGLALLALGINGIRRYKRQKAQKS